MAKQRGQAEGVDKSNELLRTMAIVQLGLAGVPQANIRAIVGGAMSDVTRILKLLRVRQRGKE